jgi:hypothetical protein
MGSSASNTDDPSADWRLTWATTRSDMSLLYRFDSQRRGADKRIMGHCDLRIGDDTCLPPTDRDEGPDSRWTALRCPRAPPILRFEDIAILAVPLLNEFSMF